MMDYSHDITMAQSRGWGGHYVEEAFFGIFKYSGMRN